MAKSPARPEARRIKDAGSGTVPTGGPTGALLIVKTRFAGPSQHSVYFKSKAKRPAAPGLLTLKGVLTKPVGPGWFTTLPMGAAKVKTTPSSWPTTKAFVPAFRKVCAEISRKMLSENAFGLKPFCWLVNVGLFRKVCSGVVSELFVLKLMSGLTKSALGSEAAGTTLASPGVGSFWITCTVTAACAAPVKSAPARTMPSKPPEII